MGMARDFVQVLRVRTSFLGGGEGGNFDVSKLGRGRRSRETGEGLI